MALGGLMWFWKGIAGFQSGLLAEGSLQQSVFHTGQLELVRVGPEGNLLIQKDMLCNRCPSFFPGAGTP